MKIASFNANGIRARMPVILRWLEEQVPDILCIQETKVQDFQFPVRAFEDAGYHSVFRGQKSYNGVAVISRIPPLSACFGFNPDDDEQVRLARIDFDRFTVVNTYVPQGQSPDSEKFQYKLDWLSRLRSYFETGFSASDSLIWAGDFNIAPHPIDVYDPQALAGSICYHPLEHRALDAIRGLGFTDVYRKHKPDDPGFSFWDYRIPNALKRKLGWRIDHIWATTSAAEKSRSAWIDAEPRTWEKPSDHTFIVAVFDL